MKVKGYIVGDILLQRRLNLSNPNLIPIMDLFKQADLVIGNLETTVHANEGNPAAFPGGCYSMCPPRSLKELYELNFRMMNIANNHTMDYGERGLKATIRYLKEYDFAYCGAGENLEEASRPCYYEAPGARIAMIGATSSFHDSYSAGPGNGEVRGRAGVNPLRHNAEYHVPESDFNRLVEIGGKMGLNDYHDQARKEGYLSDLQYFKMGGVNCVSDDSYFVETKPNRDDEMRILNNVKEAHNNADFVIVSLHGHQFKNKNKTETPDFVAILARECVEAGADIVVCTGPHVLRTAEKYKNGYILYGLGNFIFQHTLMERLPEEFYNKYGTTRQATTGVSEIMEIRSCGGKKGLTNDPKAWESVIVKFEKNGDKLCVSFLPIKIHKDGVKVDIGLPYLCNTHNSMEII